MFNYSRKSTSGHSIPSWVKPGPVYVRNQPRRSKSDPLVSPATLIHANPQYAHVRLQSGVKTTVKLRDIARHPDMVEEDVGIIPIADITEPTSNSLEGLVNELSPEMPESEQLISHNRNSTIKTKKTCVKTPKAFR